MKKKVLLLDTPERISNTKFWSENTWLAFVALIAKPSCDNICLLSKTYERISVIKSVRAADCGESKVSVQNT